MQSKTKGKKSLFHRSRKLLSELGLFLILLVLPAITIWIAAYAIENNLLAESKEEALREMSEMTAHMLRMVEPETYYQESIRRLSESFRWTDNIGEIPRISTKEKLELALFDPEGKRLKWPENEFIVKRESSETFLNSLKELSIDSAIKFSPKTQSVNKLYSGNLMTLSAMVATPNTLINFQGIGLQKMGGWFKVRFHEKDENGHFKEGHLLAWLDLHKLEKYALADQALVTMERLVGSNFNFSYIDLNNSSVHKSTHKRKMKSEMVKILSSNSLKTGFEYGDELVSLNDTNEGLRLICSRQTPKALPIVKKLNRLFLVIIPVLALIFLWKKAFNVNFSMSVKVHAILIFGFAAITGIASMFIGTSAYQYEKQITLTQQFKNNAIEILEKVDQQYTESYSDLLLQYRQLMKDLGAINKEPKKILAPLLKFHAQDTIAYALYVDQYGRTLFQAPEKTEINKSTSIADRYSKLVTRIALQSIKTFNASRNTIPPSLEPAAVETVTSQVIEGLMHNLSTFVNVKLDSEEGLAFMDFLVDENDFAKGCLIIIHEPAKLERTYLAEAGKSLYKSTGFQLLAFPKTVASMESYYPRYSYIREEPLWKLNDTVNQTQLPSFKEGRVMDESSIVAAISAHNLNNFNLFLVMPKSKIKASTFSLSNLFMIGLAIMLIIMGALSYYLIESITSPVKVLTENATAIQQDYNEDESRVVFSNNTELESISTGLTNLVAKVKEFEENKNLCLNLIPYMPFKNSSYIVDSFINKEESDNKSLCYIGSPEDNFVFAFLMRIDNCQGLNASLPLVMSGMAIKMFAEHHNLRSPIDFLKNLEEYFRISLRLPLEGSALVMTINSVENTLSFAGFGHISLIECNKAEGNCEIVELPFGESYLRDIKAIGDRTISLKEGASYVAISEPFSMINLEALRLFLEKESFAQDDFEEKLKRKVRELSENESSASTIAFVHYKSKESQTNV